MAKVKKTAVKTKAMKGKKTQQKNAFQKVFDKKSQIEFFVALLSIPFFLSVILINFNTLRSLDKSQETPTPAIQTTDEVTDGAFYAAPIGTVDPTEPVTTNAAAEPCDESLGPVSISSPDEDEVVTENPVNVLISYDDSTYCEAAWSYRINGGSWSGYDNRSVALYNLPKGEIKFELRIRSIVSNDETTVIRNFIYNGQGSSVIPSSASASGQ